MQDQPAYATQKVESVRQKGAAEQHAELPQPSLSLQPQSGLAVQQLQSQYGQYLRQSWQLGWLDQRGAGIYASASVNRAKPQPVFQDSTQLHVSAARPPGNVEMSCNLAENFRKRSEFARQLEYLQHLSWQQANGVICSG